MTTFRLNPNNSYEEEGRPWYDTKAGIEKSIKTLNDFLELRHVRRVAGYDRKERLNQIYVFGDYSFDVCGNCAVAQPSIRKRFPNIPNVLTHNEYWAFIENHPNAKNFEGISFAHGQSIPAEHLLCPICNEGWTIENMSDVVTRESSEFIETAEFVGKTLLDLKEFYGAKTDAKYYIGYEPFLHNLKFIDKSPWTDNPRTELEKKMVKNEYGHVGTKDGITDNYVLSDGDKVHFAVVHFYHKECNKKDLDLKMNQLFQEIFAKAGFMKHEAIAIPNEYCGCPHCPPWYIVTTEIGKFKIGWRKRVINIDWKDLNLTKKVVSKLFLDEDVTKGINNIHAWSDEKAIEYLGKIFDHYKKLKR